MRIVDFSPESYRDRNLLLLFLSKSLGSEVKALRLMKEE